MAMVRLTCLINILMIRKGSDIWHYGRRSVGDGARDVSRGLPYAGTEGIVGPPDVAVTDSSSHFEGQLPPSPELRGEFPVSSKRRYACGVLSQDHGLSFAYQEDTVR